MASLVRSTGFTAFARNPMYTVGKLMRKVGAKLVFPTTGANGDQYILAGPLSLDDRISRIYSNAMPALTSATNANLGFYKSSDNGATLAGLSKVTTTSDVALWSGVSLATAATVFADQLTTKNGALDNTKAIRDLLLIGPDQEPIGGIFLVLTLPTANTAGGTWDADVEIEEATTR